MLAEASPLPPDFAEPPQPLKLPASVLEIAILRTIQAGFDEPLQHLERLKGQLKSFPEPNAATAPESKPHRRRKRSGKSGEGLLLQATLRYLEQIDTVPLLPAPPIFERAFARFEGMFHTVFFRKYPYILQADAKQEALLRLWLAWKRDLTLLEQSPAFVVQAALWGASPFGKKRAKIDRRERPLPQHDRYWEAHTPQTSRDPAWMHRLDRQIDVQHAIQRVRERIIRADKEVERLAVLEHVVAGKTKVQGRRESGLSIRTYQRHRAWVEQALREVLADYRPI